MPDIKSRRRHLTPISDGGDQATAEPSATGPLPPLSRRGLGGLAGLALLTPLLDACGTSASATPAAAAAKPTPGGSVIYAVDTEPVTFDIHVASQDIAGEILRNVFDSLVAEDVNGAFHPWLATSWTYTEDLTSYTFKLRQDVKFSDGTPFDAAAVKANFDRIAAPSTKSQLAASLLGPYTGTDVVDQYTAKVNFSKSYAPFLQAASTAYLGFYSPKTITANSASLGSGGPVDVGTGPFTFTGYTKGQSVVLTKNPDYAWGPATAAHTGPAYLDQLTIRFLAEDSTRVGALTSGQVGVARALPPVDIKTLAANPAFTVVHRNDPGGVYNIFLNASRAPLDDINVRKAIQRGINIDLDVKTVYFGQYERAWSPLSPSTPDFDASLENSWPYDQAQADQLLDQAGWTTRDAQGYRTKNGQRLVIDWPVLPPAYITDQRDILGQAIQADLKKIGIQVNRPQPDIGDYITQIYGGQTNFIDFTWARFEPDVLWLFFNSASTPQTGGQNATFIADAQLDQWTDQGRTTIDPATRKTVYGEVQKRVVQDLAVIVPIYVPETIIGVSKKVSGLSFDPNAWALFYDVWSA
ncbi:MAG TPA: ABC transporter substrate-binding protein [Actinocrinis sp.]|nr:ABC transporter substrate-binding protein [Actinocrinis sp.]